MAIPVAAISAGLGVARQIFKKKPKFDNRRAIAELRAARPVGYLTPEDMRASELTRGRLMAGVQAQGKLAGYEIGRRFQSRGLAGSPSEERARARLNDQTLLGAENAGNTAEEQIYNIRTGREGFERQKALDIFGAQTGLNTLEYQRQQAENGAFWNSLNEFMPAIVGALKPASAPTEDVKPYGPMPATPSPTAPGYQPGFKPETFPPALGGEG